jgi:hydroxymethylpyrimidine pyrophosphatase-like HAD family hydrolase
MRNGKRKEIRMVVTDLDGTLLNDRQEISRRDTETLEWLGQKNICRVIATGRNLFSAKKILPPGVPVDYLVFSTGAGAIDWKTGELIFAEHFLEKDVTLAMEALTGTNVSFMVHNRVPDNHYFWYHDASCGVIDFHRRCELYRDYATPLGTSPRDFSHISQFLAIVPENSLVLEKLKTLLASLRVIRTTSPLDKKSMWIEIFPRHVSKGHTVERLCKMLGVVRSGTMGIGNDYNDIELLNFVGYPFAVNNSPEIFKENYPSCRSNNENGFTDAVLRVLDP